MTGVLEVVVVWICFINHDSSFRIAATSLLILVLASSARVMRLVDDVWVFCEVSDTLDVTDCLSTSWSAKVTDSASFAIVLTVSASPDRLNKRALRISSTGAVACLGSGGVNPDMSTKFIESPSAPWSSSACIARSPIVVKVYVSGW